MEQGDFRVVQMTPPGSACSVTIGTGLVDSAPGSLKGLRLVVADIEAARADLLSRGVEVSSIQHHDGTRFAEGNAWAVQESPTLRAVSGG